MLKNKGEWQCFQGLGAVEGGNANAPTRAHNLATLAADAANMSVEAYKGWTAVDGTSNGSWAGHDADMRERLRGLGNRDASLLLHREGVGETPNLVHPR